MYEFSIIAWACSGTSKCVMQHEHCILDVKIGMSARPPDQGFPGPENMTRTRLAEQLDIKTFIHLGNDHSITLQTTHHGPVRGAHPIYKLPVGHDGQCHKLE